MKKTLFSILFSLALAASLAGCGGAASSTAAARASYSSMDSAPQAYAADAGGTAAEAAGTSDLSDAVQNSADLLPQDGRKIILNATLSIEALDFNATCTALARAASPAADMSPPPASIRPLTRVHTAPHIISSASRQSNTASFWRAPAAPATW